MRAITTAHERRERADYDIHYLPSKEPKESSMTLKDFWKE